MRGLILVSWLTCVATAAAAQEASFDSIPWESGPHHGSVGNEAAVNVPEGCVFTGAPGTKQFLTLTENPTNGRERATVYCWIDRGAGTERRWFAVFEFDASGYVKDDDRSSLDPAAILKSIQEGTESANEIRRKNGWGEFHVRDWARAPYYDAATNNLTWAIVGDDGLNSGDKSINHSVRLLGRRGVMSADLVVAAEDYEAALPRFESLIATFAYNDGERYAQWTQGDKIAEYGLAALIGGAAGAVLVKSGFLQKFGKLLAIAGLAALGALKRLFTGAKPKESTNS